MRKEGRVYRQKVSSITRRGIRQTRVVRNFLRNKKRKRGNLLYQLKTVRRHGENVASTALSSAPIHPAYVHCYVIVCFSKMPRKRAGPNRKINIIILKCSN